MKTNRRHSTYPARVALALAFLLAGCQGQAATTVAPAPKQSSAPVAHPTPLDRYIAAPDTNYQFRLVTTASIPGGKLHILEMTSQAWLKEGEVDRPVWKHWLAVTCPDEIRHPTALLLIGGGSHRQPLPATPEMALNRTMRDFVRLAVTTKSVVVELHDVPNQPLTFHNDGTSRLEDDLVAYTFAQFLRSGDERWPALLPMTKSAVRAMDAVTEFCSRPEAGSHRVENFVVTGMSKRGWTTWLTAAADPRVIAIAPVVIDMLNIETSFRHHFAAYGFWAPAVTNYVEQRIMDWMGTPQFEELKRIVDPYEYRGRYTMPKLIVNAACDQFFLPDSSQFYFSDLPGPKFLRYVPNADHSLRGSDAWDTLQSFYQSVLEGSPMPRFDWSAEPDGAVRIRAMDKPREVRLWQATNPEKRDFRLDAHGPNWTNAPLAAADGVYIARVPAPQRGWTAFFVELVFDGPGGRPIKLTTDVRVVPDRTDHQFVPRRPAESR